MDHIGKGFRNYMSRPGNSEKFEKMVQSILADSDVQTFLSNHQEQISQEIISNSYSKLHEFVQEKQKLAKGEEGQNPGYIPELALNAGYIDVVYMPSPETIRKEREKELRSRINSINISKDARSATMEKFLPTQDRMEALELAFGFVEAYHENPKDYHKALYLHGPFGVGKTYLLGAIAYELSLHGHLTTLMHYPTFTQEMKASIADNSVPEKLDIIKNSEILMLDDIGAEVNSTWIRDEVLGVILQHRMQEKLPTFFSSNLTFKELEGHLRVGNRGEDEPIKAKRLMERIKYLSKEVTMTGKNRRLEE
ncbi:primosomal protein DnaI [Jeotgalibaca ciconiae]|uniref:Primosomal protein DnaI n=1 Tax=Jeotgalibaca ciconiae TaxID=2496265 RepID=A0A3S9HCD2_9LACT|nr:primosomal protein DnaI [Jeotgalibaca ciconiae]AZP05030.1 primosomal protein DnaI [Jeotgalibaca ciconiae]HJB24503.1 primosomal protein DnaI [Candidatus Jeotgalibaca pullicola]